MAAVLERERDPTTQMVKKVSFSPSSIMGKVWSGIVEKRHCSDVPKGERGEEVFPKLISICLSHSVGGESAKVQFHVFHPQLDCIFVITREKMIMQ